MSAGEPETNAGLPAGWRTLIPVLIGGGLLLAVLGLWQVLAAEAGTDPKNQTLQDIRAVHGTLTSYEVYLAAKAARRLQWADAPSPSPFCSSSLE